MHEVTYTVRWYQDIHEVGWQGVSSIRVVDVNENTGAWGPDGINDVMQPGVERRLMSKGEIPDHKNQTSTMGVVQHGDPKISQNILQVAR